MTVACMPCETRYERYKTVVGREGFHDRDWREGNARGLRPPFPLRFVPKIPVAGVIPALQSHKDGYGYDSIGRRRHP